jgi:hypothetical protein
MDAVFALHKEWGELVALRREVRAAPYDEDAERNLVARLRTHEERLHALKASILESALNGRPPAAPAGAPARPLARD